MPASFIVIVNYRTAPLVVDCLASLVSGLDALGGGRVIVVDNASGDESVPHIRSAVDARGWGGWAEVIALPRNGGFAYGNNRAIERVRELDAAFNAIVCVNPDAVLRPGAVAALLGQLESDNTAGIVGASIEDERGDLQITAHLFPSPLGELLGAAQLSALSRLFGAHAVARTDNTSAYPCDWVSGACFAVRRAMLDSIGPFDEGYFLYFEETDFCLRARQAGWTCWFVPTARAMHFEGAATGIRTPRQRRPAYWYASRRRFFVKAHGVAGLIAADACWAVGRLSLVIRRAVGLGGRFGVIYEPVGVAGDLLWGDVRAGLKGELRSIRPLARRRDVNAV